MLLHNIFIISVTGELFWRATSIAVLLEVKFTRDDAVRHIRGAIERLEPTNETTRRKLDTASIMRSRSVSCKRGLMTVNPGWNL